MMGGERSWRCGQPPPGQGAHGRAWALAADATQIYVAGMTQTMQVDMETFLSKTVPEGPRAPWVHTDEGWDRGGRGFLDMGLGGWREDHQSEAMASLRCRQGKVRGRCGNRRPGLVGGPAGAIVTTWLSTPPRLIRSHDDMPAHVKSSMLGASVTIPITSGRLNLGTWQVPRPGGGRQRRCPCPTARTHGPVASCRTPPARVMTLRPLKVTSCTSPSHTRAPHRASGCANTEITAAAGAWWSRFKASREGAQAVGLQPRPAPPWTVGGTRRPQTQAPRAHGAGGVLGLYPSSRLKTVAVPSSLARWGCQRRRRPPWPALHGRRPCLLARHAPPAVHLEGLTTCFCRPFPRRRFSSFPSHSLLAQPHTSACQPGARAE